MSAPLGSHDINGPFVDRLIASLLRASTMLSEVGHALRIQNPESVVATQVIFEADAARTEAQRAMAEQSAANTARRGPL